MAKKYIDADEFLKSETKRCGSIPIIGTCTTDNESLAYRLATAPKADVVEVVRCKDCRYFTEGMAVGMCKRIEDKPIIPCCFDHFCSYGERRKDDDV